LDTNFWVIQAFNGISYGALLFLLASGLSLVFGVMRIVNFAHDSFFLPGALSRAHRDLDDRLLAARDSGGGPASCGVSTRSSRSC
jgi:hypothetical protein